MLFVFVINSTRHVLFLFGYQIVWFQSRSAIAWHTILLCQVIPDNNLKAMYEAFNLPSNCCYNKSTCSHNKSTCHDKLFLRQHEKKTAFSRIWHRSIVFVTTSRYNKLIYCYNKLTYWYNKLICYYMSTHVDLCNELGGWGGRRRLDSDTTDVGLLGFPKEQQTHSGDGIWWFNY